MAVLRPVESFVSFTTSSSYRLPFTPCSAFCQASCCHLSNLPSQLHSREKGYHLDSTATRLSNSPLSINICACKEKTSIPHFPRRCMNVPK